MNKIVAQTLLTLACSGLLAAQTDTASQSDYDELIAHLNLTETQVTCLETNKTAFRDAITSQLEELRSLQRQLREAAANGADTTSLQSQIDAVKASIQSVQTTFVSSARGCLDSAQQAQIGELVQAETLLNEVRQGVGLLLLQSTEERSGGFGAGRGGPGRGRR